MIDVPIDACPGRTDCTEALRKGRAANFAPLTVAILDTGGHLTLLKREDGSGILRSDIAIGKVWGALGMCFGTRELAQRPEKMPSFIAALGAVSGGRVVPVPGGALIRNAQWELVGAIGISGDTSDNDEICLVHGVESAGVRAQTGAALP